MQCNWSTAAANIWKRGGPSHKLRCFSIWHGSRPTTRISCWRTSSLCKRKALFLSTEHSAVSSSAPYSTPARMVQQHDDDTLSVSVPEHFSSKKLRAAYLSRAAAQAVRLCAATGDLRGALYVVNSLHHSTYDYPLDPTLPGRGHGKLSKLDFIQFGQAVPPRLSAHCFLHAMLRAGLPTRAGRYAEMMMKQGFRLRTATLEAIVESVCKAPSTSRLASAFPSILKPKQAPGGETVLKLNSTLVEDPLNRAAIRILHHARKFGQQRTQRMYDAIIQACLLQGEIIVASLLFVILVKDWQARKARAALKSQPANADESMNGTSSAKQRQLHPIHNSLLETPYPKLDMMVGILHDIETTMSKDPQNPSDEERLQSALQALANLAMLIEHRHIHFGKLSPLIRALYSCPKTNHYIWVIEGNKPVRVRAYAYCHGVLIRILGSFTDRQRGAPSLPPLDRRSYNSLLFYALRHRLSPSHATNVLRHMVIDRKLKPDIVTYNTLLRCATLLRKTELSELALKVLKLPVGLFNSRTPEPNSAHAVDSLAEGAIWPTRFGRKLRRLAEDKVDLPEVLFDRDPKLAVDEYTLTSFVTYLTATGRPRSVEAILFRLLPELQIVDHPSWGSLSEEERRELKDRSREECLQRAVAYGPLFFATILNALVKAGRTGLAERVWILAQEAQEASWSPDFMPGVKPWFLPVHAYTAMLQCYAAEASKGVPRRSNRRLVHEGNDVNWTPQRHHTVRGWAHFIFTRRRVDRSRHAAGRDMGLILYRSMVTGGRAVFDSLMRINQAPGKKVPSTVVPPAPDARFFNAALDLFSRQPHMVARPRRSSRAHWTRTLRFALREYVRQGRLSPSWTPMLQEVAEKMVEAGFAVPHGFRHIFVGRWAPGTEGFQSRKTVLRSPNAYPHKFSTRFRPHALMTTKTAGLPVRRGRQPVPMKPDHKSNSIQQS